MTPANASRYRPSRFSRTFQSISICTLGSESGAAHDRLLRDGVLWCKCTTHAIAPTAIQRACAWPHDRQLIASAPRGPIATKRHLQLMVMTNLAYGHDARPQVLRAVWRPDYCRVFVASTSDTWSASLWSGPSSLMTDVMRFCGNCDRPFSWTTQKLYAAKAMADELGGLSDADRIESEGELRRRCRRHADN